MELDRAPPAGQQAALSTMDSVRGHAGPQDPGPEAQPAGRPAGACVKIFARSDLLRLILQSAYGNIEGGLPKLAPLPKTADPGGGAGADRVRAERRPGTPRQRVALRLPPEGLRGVHPFPKPPDYSDELLLDLLRAGL